MSSVTGTSLHATQTYNHILPHVPTHLHQAGVLPQAQLVFGVAMAREDLTLVAAPLQGTHLQCRACTCIFIFTQCLLRFFPFLTVAQSLQQSSRRSSTPAGQEQGFNSVVQFSCSHTCQGATHRPLQQPSPAVKALGASLHVRCCELLSNIKPPIPLSHLRACVDGAEAGTCVGVPEFNAPVCCSTPCGHQVALEGAPGHSLDSSLHEGSTPTEEHLNKDWVGKQREASTPFFEKGAAPPVTRTPFLLP
eukprot:scaffold225730_cov23-Tisochrysis_lutea.AAC.3